MKTPTPHPHAEFITEAVKDTSRKIEGQLPWSTGFEPSNLSRVIACAESWTFRFADTVKPVIVSSLTDGEFYSCNGTVKPMREIANAAASRAIKELPLLSCELNYSDLHIMWVRAKGDEMLLLRAIAIAVRDDYIKQVKAGKK